METATRTSFHLFVRRLRRACRAAFDAAAREASARGQRSDDVQLFLTTFAGGFLFVSILLA